MSTTATSLADRRTCPRCQKPVRSPGDGCCSACWEPYGREQYPVQCASEPDELAALEDRYQAVATDPNETLTRFERAVQDQSAAVVTMPWRQSTQR